MLVFSSSVTRGRRWLNEMAQSETHLLVGLAGTEITPDRPLLLEGYGDRSGPATGTRDPLEARAIVFDDGERRAAIVTVDLCGLQLASTARIRAVAEAASGVPGENIVIAFSHTHSSPYTTTYLNVTPDAEYLHWLEATLAGLVATAAGQLRPASLGAGVGAVDFNVNRRFRTPNGTIMRANPARVVDRRVLVLRIDPAPASPAPGTLGGRVLPQSDPIALIFAHACHPTILRGESNRYSGDYPGEARRFVEAVYESEERAAPGFFLNGCAGNLRPHLLAADGSFRSGTDHEVTVLGRWLGSEVINVAERIAGEPVDRIGVARREIALPYAQLPDTSELHRHLDGPRRVWAAAWLDRLEREESLPAAETTEVQVLRLGRHWIVALPGETTLEIGQSVERGLIELGLVHPERGDLTLVTGYANDYVAYLCSASMMTEGGYEPESWWEYTRPAPFTSDVEPLLVDTALELALELSRMS